jgi:hypothetical protein
LDRALRLIAYFSGMTLPMKKQFFLFGFSALLIAACHSTKKNSGTAANKASNTTPVVVTAPVAPAATVAKSSDGVHAPGNEELTAIQNQYKDVTIDKLNEGHILYTKGACVNCHNAKNIYRRNESSWKEIIEDMGKRANLNESQKDAVYKYVLAIKAAQPK